MSALATRKYSEILREMPRDQWQVQRYRSEGCRVLPDPENPGRLVREDTSNTCYCATGWLLREVGREDLAIGGTRREVAEALGVDVEFIGLLVALNDCYGLDAVIAYLEEQGL